MVAIKTSMRVEPIIKKVGTTKFQAAGKPLNQWSSVSKSVRANHSAENKNTAPTMSVSKCVGSNCKRTSRASGTSTQVM